jgi:hypothetical protein
MHMTKESRGMQTANRILRITAGERISGAAYTRAVQHAELIDLGEAIKAVAIYDSLGEPIDVEIDDMPIATAIEIDIEAVR